MNKTNTYLYSYLVSVFVSIFIIILGTILIYIHCARGHNEYRHRHRSPSLTISNELVKYAKQRAEELKTNFGHKTNLPFGENLYQGTITPELYEKFKCESALKHWYNEIHNYDFVKGVTKGGLIYHFTQMVWSDTTHIGCAKSYSPDKMVMYLVCNYNPRGNWLGSFKEKVPPLY